MRRGERERVAGSEQKKQRLTVDVREGCSSAFPQLTGLQKIGALGRSTTVSAQPSGVGDHTTTLMRLLIDADSDLFGLLDK